MAYHQGNIAGLDDANTRRLIASTVLTESNGGDLTITNREGYIGRYQAGASWLADAGYIDREKLRNALAGYRSEWAWASAGHMTIFLNDPSNWTSGLNLEKYKASAELQDNAFRINSSSSYNQAIRNGVLRTSDNQEKIAGFLKARHIAGYGGAVAAVTGGQEVRDNNGTSNYNYMEDITRNRDGLSGRMDQSRNQYSEIDPISHGRTHALLRQGMKTEQVRELQSRLQALGYADKQYIPLRTDGHFGQHTHEAVKAFQRDHDLTVDGTAGPNTWAALHEAARTQSITTFPKIAPPLDLDVIAIRTLQQQLNMLGMTDHRNQALRLTETYDDATRVAVMEFQRGQGLPCTGLADPATRGLIEARATIATLQQSASTHATTVHDISLLERPAHTPSTLTVARQNQSAPPEEMTLLHHLAHKSHLTHGAGSLSATSLTSLESAASRSHHDALPDQNPLAAMRAQLHDMQHQMDAVHRQREKEREKERLQEDSRSMPNEPAHHNTREAQRHETGASPATQPLSYSNPNHPQHALYARLKELLPSGTTEERLEQSTAACYMGRITRPEQLHQIHIRDDAVHFLTTRPDAYASISLDQPAPTVQQTMWQVQTHDQQQAQMLAQFEVQRRESNARGGPTLHGPAC